jgi:hypothetical protein
VLIAMVTFDMASITMDNFALAAIALVSIQGGLFMDLMNGNSQINYPIAYNCPIKFDFSEKAYGCQSLTR